MHQDERLSAGTLVRGWFRTFYGVLMGSCTALLDLVVAVLAVPKLPATVTDARDTEVTVTGVDRILAFDLHGTLGATVFGLGLGDRMVGRDTSTGFPPRQRFR